MCISKGFFFLTIIISISILPNYAKKGDKQGILGGNPSGTNENTYAVSIWQKYNNDPTDTSYICSGSIIADQFIISAASCFVYPDNELNINVIHVVTWEVQENEDSDIRHITYEIGKIYIPNSFDPQTLLHNIAVVKLKEPMETGKYHIQKLRIPTKTRSNFANKDEVTVAGFGYNEVTVTVDENGKVEDLQGETNLDLYTANAMVFSNAKCSEHFGDVINDSIICAKMVREDVNDRNYGTCKVDEGAPLVYKSKTLIGVLSKVTEACDETVDPALYTRVTSHLEFIGNALNDRIEDMRIIVHD